MPAGLLVTFPEAVPTFFTTTLSVWGTAARTNALARETPTHIRSTGHETLTKGLPSSGILLAVQAPAPPVGLTEVTTFGPVALLTP